MKKIIVVSFVLAAIIASTVWTSCKKEETTTTFYGIVTDEKGNGIPGVDVVVGYELVGHEFVGYGRTVTDSDGYFELIVTQEEGHGEYVYYEFYKKGYETFYSRILASIGQGQRHRLDCVLYPE